MLEILRRIVQDVNKARDLYEAVDIIVTQLKGSMSVDVASVYLTDFEKNIHVLMASYGLNMDVKGGVWLQLDEGLVGLVARRAEPVNVSDAPEHPQFRYFPGTGEEKYQAFLGVPVIHQRTVLGVLVVQQKINEPFDEETVSFLITLAAQLAGSIAHAKVSDLGSVTRRKDSLSEQFVSGVPGATGVGLGTAVVVYPPADLNAVPDREIKDIDNEIWNFNAAIAFVKHDFRQMRDRMQSMLSQEEGAVFDAYALMLESRSFVDGVNERIRQGSWAQAALRDVIFEHVQKFEDMEDKYLRERAYDIREIGRRILMVLQENISTPMVYPKRTVLVGDDIGVTQLAEVPSRRIVGVISSKGSSSTHVAILARAMGIPAVMGASDLSISRMDGRDVIVDGYQGRVYIRPGMAVRREYARLAREEMELSEDLKSLKDLPAETPDGFRIPLYVNTGLLADIKPSQKSGAEGIGLYRTEFPFMIRERFPGEEEQRKIYQEALKVFAPRPVVLRTLDVGGDKALPYFPITEDNPFLGWRGVRITLDHPEIFLTQLRAMLRAAKGLDNLHVLFPMISDVGELADCIELLDQAFDELEEEGDIIKWPKVGAMIEVPSAVFQVDAIAQRVDFLSIGTNDLTQYILAVDRNNARVAKLYRTLHPAVLRAITLVIEAGKKHKRPVNVCGEMAGDPAAAILLMGMGVDSLSMAVASLPRVKWVIRSFTRRRARSLLKKAILMEDATDIRELLNHALEEAGLGGLIRAGK